MKCDKSILYIIPSLSSGGAEHQTVNQVNRLAELGVDISLVVLTDRLDLFPQLNLPKARVHFLNIKDLAPLGLKSFPKIPLAINKLRSSMSINAPDVVVAILPVSHLIVRICKLIYGGQYCIWSYHRSMQYEANPLDTFAKRAFHYLNCSLVTRTDYGHLFISGAVKKNISTYLPIKNGRVLHNAVPERYECEEKAKKDLSRLDITLDDSYLVIIPGRLHPSKGHAFFLSALHSVLQNEGARSIKVVFVGGGPLEAKLRSAIKDYELEEQVFITGFVDNSLLLSYLALASLVVIPSINEGFGNVAIESLMQGATVLASNTGGLPEIIEDGVNGFLFEKENSDDLSQKFKMIYAQRIKLESAILQKSYAARFTLEAQIRKLLAILNE